MLGLWVVMIFIIVQFIAMKIKIISIFVNYAVAHNPKLNKIKYNYHLTHLLK